MSTHSRTVVLVSAVLTAGLAAITGCEPSPTPRTPASSQVVCHPIPSVEDLQKMLDQALDPSVPSKDKTDLLEDGDKDPQLFDQLVQAFQENPDTKYQIKDQSRIDVSCKLHVFFSIAKGDQHLDAVEILFVWQNDRWKLSKDSVCALVVLILQKTSPLCGGYTPPFPRPPVSLPPGITTPEMPPASTTTG